MSQEQKKDFNKPPNSHGITDYDDNIQIDTKKDIELIKKLMV